jgi:GNAT superfamily N-acetyltransferase
LRPPVTLRPIDLEVDRELLLQIYSDSRDDIALLLDWTEEQRQAFIEMQFDAQDSYYRAEYGGCAFDLILADGEPAGRLYVDRRATEIRIVDIALLSSFRRRGIGSLLLQDIHSEARELGLPVTIHVASNNPAMRLYADLGYTKLGEAGVYWLMQWTPTTT